MNIVILIHSMSSGGAERVIANLTNEWIKRDWQVTVITLTPKSMDFYELDSGISRIALDLARESPNTLKAIFSNLYRIIAIRRELHRLAPDIMLGVMATSSVLAILASMRLGIPVIGTEHIYPPMQPLNFFWERVRRWTYSYAASVVMLTGEGLIWLNDRIPGAHGVVIPNPVP
ncbi:MAG: glycosyltransferase, partial [Proteobacteria bacterium]|nr:glycosyltransferase [Pseudomonadota bacterium]